MSGSDKTQVTRDRQVANPRCFKWFRMDNLRVHYYINKKCLNDEHNFSGVACKLERSYKKKSRKILRIIDNCAAHPHMDCLKNMTTSFYHLIPQAWFNQLTWV